jgi:hypothetical protein
VTTTTHENDTFIGTDSSFSFLSYAPKLTPATIGNPDSSLTLLASLVLQTPSQMIGDSFTVSVISTGTYFNTNFDGSTNVGFNVSTADGFNGNVTIANQQIVPERASTLAGLTGALLLTGYGVLRHRRQRGKD